MFILYFILGTLTMLFVVGMIRQNKINKITWSVWLLECLGVFLLLFAIAWTVSSVVEGEPRAASMGMIFFGIPAVILIALGLRKVKNSKTE